MSPRGIKGGATGGSWPGVRPDPAAPPTILQGDLRCNGPQRPRTGTRHWPGRRPQRSGGLLSVLPCANSGVTAVLTVTGLMRTPVQNDRPSCGLRMTWAAAREAAAAGTPRATTGRKCRCHQSRSRRRTHLRRFKVVTVSRHLPSSIETCRLDGCASVSSSIPLILHSADITPRRRVRISANTMCHQCGSVQTLNLPLNSPGRSNASPCLDQVRGDPCEA